MIRRTRLTDFLNKPKFYYEIFHQKTKLREFPPETEMKDWPENWKKISFKGYSRLKEVRLPEPSLPKVTLEKALLGRKSARDYHGPISIRQLSSLLYFSCGLQRNINKYKLNRFYPSAGARYPLETYVISQYVKGLQNGLYHYYIRSHSLEKLMEFDTFDHTKYFRQASVGQSAAIILVSAIFNRTTVKYGNRGYRFVMLEAGHLGQNIYLISAALNMGCCAIGGFIENKLDKLVDIDGLHESVIYAFALGNRNNLT